STFNRYLWTNYFMNICKTYWERIKNDLERVSTAQKAESSRRYFPHGVNCIGATASDIKLIISHFQAENEDMSAKEMLTITEYILLNAEFSEEVLIAFGLINKFVNRHYDDDLLLRFEYWLEHYATNWSHVDDLCIKTIYQFFLSRPHLIEKTNHWAYSKIPWCRRASNVVWVKFVKRKIGNSIYYLNKELVFKHCDLLINDQDEFVQKSIGWLLKATSVHHQDAVIKYIEMNVEKMTRLTIRYAIEKMDPSIRKGILSLGK
ncbi:MAG: 3-methyladenine DNA glycosylase AlkD, partial [Psychromonas sp.]